MKKQPTEREKIFANYISAKWLISIAYKKPLQLNNKKQITQLKNGERILIDVLPQKTYNWPTGQWRRCSVSLVSRKCKSKPQWDISSQHLEWLLLGRKDSKIRWGCREKGIKHCWRKCKLVHRMGNPMELPQETDIEAIYDPAHLEGYLPKIITIRPLRR